MLNFKILLQKLIKKGQAELDHQSNVLSVTGSCNYTSFFQTNQMQGVVTKLAITECRERSEGIYNIAIPHIQKLLVERGVNLQFIQNFLYFNDEGKKISFHASEGSLKEYISRKTILSRDEIKTIMGQLLLAIHALHEKKLSHGDLHLGNILVTKLQGGQLFIQLCDLDTIVADKPYDAGVDVCSIFLDIFNELAYLGKFGKKEIASVNAICALTTYNAFEHTYFGETPEARKIFFDSLRALQSPHEFIGQYRARLYEAGNCFLVLREDLREIVSLAQTLDNQFDYFDSIEKDSLDEKTVGMIKAFLESLKKTVTAFNREIDISLIPEFFKLLGKLQQAANEKYVLIEQQFKLKQKNYKQEFEAVIASLDIVIHKTDNSFTPILGTLLKNIRDAVNQNQLPEQNLVLLIELAYGIVITLNNPDQPEFIQRLQQIVKSIPTVFPGLSTQWLEDLQHIQKKGLSLSSVWLFAEKALSAKPVQSRSTTPSLEHKIR